MFLTDLYETTDYRSHNKENSNKAALFERLEQILPFLAEHFECMEDEICIGDVEFLPSYEELDFEEDEDLYYNPPDSYTEEGEEVPHHCVYGAEVPYKVILGDVDFTYYRDTDTEGLIFIGGKADFSNNCYIRSSMIQKITENAIFRQSQITELPMLQSIGGDADFNESQIIKLPMLQSIGRNAHFEESQITELPMLQNIGRDAYFEESQITELPMLQSIGRNAHFEESQITELSMLQSIGKDAIFGNQKIRKLHNGYVSRIMCEPSLITSLSNLRRIGGDAFFENSKITDFGALESIGGNAYFNGLGNVNTEQTIQVGGTAYFDSEEQIEECGEKICATSKDVGTGEKTNRRRRRGRPLEEDRQRPGEELAELMKIGQRQRQGEFIEFVNGVPSIDTVIEIEGPETEVRGDE